jgi:hypothetical protein
MKRLASLVICGVMALGYAAYAQVNATRSRGHSEGALSKPTDEAEMMSAGDMAKHMEMTNKMMVKALDGGDAQYDRGLST